jgi:hypothetical protein
VKSALLLAAVAASVLFSSCCSQTTLENRRDMFFPQKVDGPYTRMLKDGIPAPAQRETVDIAGVPPAGK